MFNPFLTRTVVTAVQVFHVGLKSINVEFGYRDNTQIMVKCPKSQL